uniref:Uncharacterized protein n=1 Tax=Arundo donax TaxID=35708 RepID=A0A0A9EPN4_ARUDO
MCIQLCLQIEKKDSAIELQIRKFAPKKFNSYGGKQIIL